jgi:hypothetical protein
MNYQKVYNEIIEKAKSRVIVEGYYERHHIIPKCIGGSNKKDNLVNLTAREHFICHWLLARSNKDPKLWFAFDMMCRLRTRQQKRYKPSSRAYKEAKEKVSEIRKANIVSEETRNKISEANKGKKRTEVQINNMSEALKGIKRSESTKKKMSESKKGNKNPTKNPEVALKISLSKKGKSSNRKGFILSENTKILISKAQKGVKKGKQAIVKCDHCGKEGGINSMNRWHNDNCKYK